MSAEPPRATACLSEDHVLLLVHGEAGAADLALANAHIDVCPLCRALVALLAEEADNEDKGAQSDETH